MSVTEADEKLEAAREHMQIALINLRAVVEDRIWGFDEFSDEAKERHRKALKKLRRAQEVLG